MRFRWLGWSGVELEHEGSSLVIDPLADARSMHAAVAEAAKDVVYPEVVPAGGDAVAGLVTHLHRDHADADALAAALADGAPVVIPSAEIVEGANDAGILQAWGELSASGLSIREFEPWQSERFGPFETTAVPAADGTGDPQVSWVVEAGGRRIIHCGDTLLHGWWWRIARELGPFDVAFLPINGAVVDFPWRQPPSPLPAVMTPEQAVLAATALGARSAVPMHFGGFELEPYYRETEDPLARFNAAAEAAGVSAPRTAIGEPSELPPDLGERASAAAGDRSRRLVA